MIYNQGVYLYSTPVARFRQEKKTRVLVFLPAFFHHKLGLNVFQHHMKKAKTSEKHLEGGSNYHLKKEVNASKTQFIDIYLYIVCYLL